MVMRTPNLRAGLGLEAYARSIGCFPNGGLLQPINAKSSTQDGHNPHWGILDELHAHKDRGLYDVVRSAKGVNAASMGVDQNGSGRLAIRFKKGGDAVALGLDGEGNGQLAIGSPKGDIVAALGVDSRGSGNLIQTRSIWLSTPCWLARSSASISRKKARCSVTVPSSYSR